MDNDDKDLASAVRELTQTIRDTRAKRSHADWQALILPQALVYTEHETTEAGAAAGEESAG